uniref:hypothetical protein n=1 Tax=Photorhabdus sp. RM322S TaxID=3342825 RepID=UPI0036DDDF55
MRLNKISIIISPFLLAVSSFSMACKTDPEIEKVIANNGLADTQVMSMYRDCTLTVISVGKENKIRLENKEAAKTDGEIKTAKYWYRGMFIPEYKTFNDNKYISVPCSKEKNFCGIAPKYTYSQKYLKNKTPGVVIEFSTKENGWLYSDFNSAGCECKIEDGTLSYGLGITGTKCKYKYKGDKEEGGLGKVFNEWLSNGEIQAQISYVLLPKDP